MKRCPVGGLQKSRVGARGAFKASSGPHGRCGAAVPQPQPERAGGKPDEWPRRGARGFDGPRTISFSKGLSVGELFCRSLKVAVSKTTVVDKLVCPARHLIFFVAHFTEFCWNNCRILEVQDCCWMPLYFDVFCRHLSLFKSFFATF